MRELIRGSWKRTLAGLAVTLSVLAVMPSPGWCDVGNPKAKPGPAPTAEFKEYVTELDVDDHIFTGGPAERDARVAETYRAVLDVALAQPKVTTVMTWELADRYSWYRSVTGPDCRPLPFGADLAPKPAYDAMIAAFQGRRRG